MSSDDELAERLRAGDEKALRTVYDRHGSAVLYLAQRMLGNRADAEDVTQLTFVAAWAGRDGYDPQRGTMLGWLLRIARRKAVDRLRSAARDDRVTETVRAQLTPPDEREAPERVVDRLVVADELGRLPEEQRRTLDRITWRSAPPAGTTSRRCAMSPSWAPRAKNCGICRHRRSGSGGPWRRTSSARWRP